MKVKRITHDARIPERAYPFDAGLDLFADETVTVPGRLSREENSAVISTGVAMGIPKNFFGKICEKSGLAAAGLSIGGGIIDSSYTGELKVIVRNNSVHNLIIKKGMKIAQLIIIPVNLEPLEEATRLGETDRGESGFGSTGE